MTILFYSSVKTKKMFFLQSYYRCDIKILKDLGHKVILSNSILDFFCFWKYDVAFLYFYRYSFFCALLAKLFRKRVYFTGGIDYLDQLFATTKQRLIQILFFKMCNLLSNKSIIVSSADWNNITKLYGGKAPRNCIKNFHTVNTDDFYSENIFLNKENIITTIAWMVNLDNVFRKGVDKTIIAFSSFVKTHPQYKLIIAGSPGAGSAYIQELIDKYHIKENVVYIGAITEEDKINLLKKSRCYMQLSLYEGLGIAAIEALAAGNIVIHSGNGGLKDALGSYGYIVDINDQQCILKALEKACFSEIDKASFNKSIEYIKTNFSYQARLNLFTTLLNKEYT